jgi:hypothetical protein
MPEANTDELEPPYHVEQVETCWLVKDVAGRTILSYRDAESAQHYTVLMNNAFSQGVKAANRLHRSGSPRA